MIDALAAEALKLRGHRATWLMVWIYPICLFLFAAGLIAHDVVSPAHGARPAPGAAQWIQQLASVWGSPLSALGRYLIAGFCAVVFAGEYGWNTWKLIVPARARWQLVLAKWTIAFGFLILAFALADLLLLGGALLRPLAGGPPLPAGISPGATAQAHLDGLIEALLPTAYTIACASLIAIATRSVLATVLLSIALISIDQLIGPIAMLLGSYAPAPVRLALWILPFYHASNAIAWFKSGHEVALVIGSSGTFRVGHQASLAALAAWTAIFAALTIAIFSRQDQN